MLFQKLKKIEGLTDLADLLKAKLKEVFFSREKDSSEDELEKELKAAHRDWKRARQYFNLVSEPELKEYAIYLIEATEKKYNFLLKKKREKTNKLEIKVQKV